mgnify:CR=1 FL=1
MSKVSIITVCKNAENTIERTIKSVISQTYKDIEYIIIDGKSSDNTVNIINKYIDKTGCFISEPDSGIYEAMNKGVKQASGEYCLFLNSDDYLYNDRVLEHIFYQKPEADIIYGDVFYDYGNGKLELKKEPDKISFYYLYNGGICHQSQFIKKELFIKYGLYDESYRLSADYELQIRLIVKHNISTFYIPHAISVFSILDSPMRTHANSQLSLIERRKAQENNFSPGLLELLDDYHKIKRSPALRVARKLGNIAIFKKIVNYLFNI